MTYEEALQSVLMYCSEGCGKIDTCRGEYKECAEAVVIKALEKQIPKMPDMWGDGYSEGEIVMESYECPKCGCIYDFDTDGKLNFCHNCGQAIDWEDDE